MQAIINGEMHEVEPAVKVILDRVMCENAELKRENKRLEEAFQKATGVIAATDCVECQRYDSDVNRAISIIREFCRKHLCDDCPIYTKNEYYPCLFRDGIAPAHWGNLTAMIDDGGADNETD